MEIIKRVIKYGMKTLFTPSVVSSYGLYFDQPSLRYFKRGHG
ncbi:hypothetical protein PROVRETT_07109 [Providencia rettgeri DSM 1131]|nr:hypothetical protein PROVRETT_07109 [Providencia rettgeri DSM 1131]